MTLEDLAAIDTVTLLRAIAERLALIETNELETKCLLPRPLDDISIYEQLQGLLVAARAWGEDDEAPVRALSNAEHRLLDAMVSLNDVKLPTDQADPGEGDPDQADPGEGDPAQVDPDQSDTREVDRDPGDIIALGQRHALLARRYTELQHLYRVRMDVTRDALKKARAQGSDTSVEVSPPAP